MNRLVIAMLATVSLLSLGCPQPTGCNSSTCQGCCDQRGACQMGVSASSCGARGMLCTECGAGLVCSSGACLFAGSGGGSTGTGGGISGGGSAAGGGIAMINQELVSGSRLRAINFVGGDGSRAPAVFWDSQLNTVCTASALVGAPPRCFPGLLVTPLVPNFGDAACTQPILGTLAQTQIEEAYTSAGLSPQVYGLTSTTMDGGAVVTFHTVARATARYLQSGTSCTPAGSAGINMWVSTGTVPVTTFLAMPMVRE